VSATEHDTPCPDCRGRGYLRGISIGGEPDECWDEPAECEGCAGSGLADEEVAA
jgi:DnaJ-class molecular chaperone